MKHLLAVLFLAGCVEGTTQPADATLDQTSEASVDVTSEASVDASVDASDASVDASVDARDVLGSTDAITDSGLSDAVALDARD